MLTADFDPATDPRWAALCARDRSADGRFVFAVVTTGVYCRPSCGARRPLPRNVRFFGAPDAAEAAGFRACKRCGPRGRDAGTDRLALVATACRAIDAAEEPPSLAELAAVAGCSPWHLARTFRRIVGLTPRSYATARQAERLRDELATSPRVSDAIFAAGYGSHARAYAQADATLGMPPATYRARGRGATLRYAAVATRLGWVAVAATERGVAAIELGEARDDVIARIRTRFAAATLIADDAALADHLARIVAYVERPSEGLALPLDVAGTAFARRVWRELTMIAPGHTATYGAIASAVGAPSAARAVARACAANPVALAIPCHRVLPASGGTGGYRWGQARKATLLAREADDDTPPR